MSPAHFHGSVGADGMRGTYRDLTGETGEWSWRGELPR